MPSQNRPSWKGVSTSTEDTTINYITEGLRNLQESTRLIRDNVSNLIQTAAYDSTTSPSGIQIEAITNDSETISSNLPDADTITQNVQEVLERNSQMKQQVEEILVSNISLKAQVEKFLEESKQWRDGFIEETKQLDSRMEEIITVDTAQRSQKIVSEGTLARKSKGWMESAGRYEG